MQTQPVQSQPSYPLVSQASYNAVKIDIHNPQVNTNSSKPPSEPVTAPQTNPIYGNVPTASVYEVPKQSIYEPQANFNQPPTAPTASPTMPSVPAPVIVAPTVQTNAPAPAPEAKKEEAPAPAPAAAPAATQTATTTDAPAKTVDVKAPVEAKPAVDVNAFLARLANPDFKEQANAMEAIADMAQNQPQKATELLDVKVVDSLLNIMQADSSKLEGPTSQQLQIREKIITGKPVTEAETVEANKISPMELAERNKQYAIYTVAIMQKLYGSEIEKTSNQVVPLTELPGAAGIVEQIKSNPNPMVRASGIDALSYIQRPEYKQDLTTLFTVAKNDKDVNVKEVAAKALEKLTQVPDAPTAPAAQAEVKKS